jgi:hypothetical protein
MLPCQGGRSCDHWPVPVRLDFSSDLDSGHLECDWPCIVQLYNFWWHKHSYYGSNGSFPCSVLKNDLSYIVMVSGLCQRR